MHRAVDKTIGNAGVVFDKRVKSMSEFLELIKAGKYGLLIDGKEYSIEELPYI